MLIDTSLYTNCIEYILLLILSLPLMAGVVKYYLTLRKNKKGRKVNPIEYLLCVALVFLSFPLYAFQDTITGMTTVWIITAGGKTPVKSEKILLFGSAEYLSKTGAHYRIRTNPSGYAVVNDSGRRLEVSPVVYSAMEVPPGIAPTLTSLYSRPSIAKGTVAYFSKLRYFGYGAEAPLKNITVTVQGDEPRFGRMEIEYWLKW